VFERFTPRARQAVVHAQEEAQGMGSDHLGVEHLLLGLLRVREGLAARVLGELGVEPDAVRAEIARVVGRGEPTPSGQIPFTPQAKAVLDRGLREALRLGHNYIGTEHLLLGLVRQEDSVAAGILRERGVTAERVEEAVLGVLAGSAQMRPGPPWGPRRRRPWQPPLYEVRPLEGAADTWAEQLNGWAVDGWTLHTVLQQDGRTVAILARRR
jgi:ATP-dependent Clp protease ATP-binding subunit ClpC